MCNEIYKAPTKCKALGSGGERDESALFLSLLMADGRHKEHTGRSEEGPEVQSGEGLLGPGGGSEKAFWKGQCVHLLAFFGMEPKPLMYLIYTSKEFISHHRAYPSGGLQGGFSGWIQGFTFTPHQPLCFAIRCCGFILKSAPLLVMR